MKSRDTANKSGICNRTSKRFVFASSVRPMGNRPAGKVAFARQDAKPIMLLFEGLIHGQYWAQTRPLGDLDFAYPPGSEWRAGLSINLATSPDGLHWKPHRHPGIRTRNETVATARIGASTPPILTERGWLTLWHAVEPQEIVGIYRTYWSILDRDDPSQVIATDGVAILEPNSDLTRPIEHQMYLRDVVFSTGIAEHKEQYIVASGEADLACRITHIPKSAFGLTR